MGDVMSCLAQEALAHPAISASDLIHVTHIRFSAAYATPPRRD